jgi:hypothetical protein
MLWRRFSASQVGRQVEQSVGSRTWRTLGMNDAAPRLCGHWLHRLSSKDKAGIDGCVMHDNRVELGAAFGRFCLRSTAFGMSLVDAVDGSSTGT